jgi:ABC-2 type transport system ATP-binding protein
MNDAPANDVPKMIEVVDLEKTFHIGFFRRKVEAVRSVSFHVEKGEVFGLLGPNGAGKTTTLKMMMGLIRMDRGRIQLLGQSAKSHHARESVGYLPENPYFHEYLTPRELLGFYGQLCGLSSAQISERRDQLIERVGLSHAATRPLRKFSKGMLQRIGIAQALIAKPSLLILDEPMSGLDPIGRKFVMDLMQELRDSGVTILFSSHILSDVERLCDRVVILNHGRKVSEGPLTELLKTDSGENRTLEDLFVEKAMALNV